MAVTVIQIVICGELLTCVNKIKGCEASLFSFTSPNCTVRGGERKKDSCEAPPVNFVDTLSFAKARNRLSFAKARLSKLVYLTFGRARPKLG